MKTNPIKAKDTEILVSGKGKTLNEVLKSSSSQKEGKIIDIGEIEVRSSNVVSGIANIALSGEQKNKLKAATTSDICKVVCKLYSSDTNYTSSSMIGSIKEYYGEKIAEFILLFPGSESFPYITLSDNTKLVCFKLLVATASL